MKHLYKALFLLFILLTVNYTKAQKVLPALKLKKGNTYYLISNANSAIVQILNSQENNTNLTFAYKMAFTVTSVSDSTYNMDASYQDIDMKIQVTGQTIEMDSKKTDTADVPSSIIAAMINKPFNIVLTKNGKIKSVTNVEKMISNVFDAFPKIDQAKKEQLKGQLIQSFGASAFKGGLEMGTAIFPSKPVAINDTWAINTTLEAPAGANVKTVYQLTGITNSDYLIHGDGTMVSDTASKAAVINGIPMKYDLNGTTITDIKIDKSTGWITEVKQKQVMKGSMIIPNSPQTPGGLTIPMTFNTDILTTDK